MFSNRVFQVTLIISLLVHGAIFIQNPNFQLFSKLKEGQNIEVSYVKPPHPEPKQELKTEDAKKKEPLLKLPERITLDKKFPPPFIDKEALFKESKPMASDKVSFAKPILLKPDIIAVKKKITLPPLELDKINNATYLSYYQIVREKIKRAAYQNYTGKEVGEVTISFVILSDGNLQGLRMVEEKSNPSPYLRKTAIRSVEDAAVFPTFPKELDYPRLSFNLAITFEVE
jgi:TonB family protein